MERTQDTLKGTVVPVILKLLAERAMYGYEIIQVVNERTGNALQWREGTLYPWLHRLEGEGLVRGAWDAAGGTRQRRYYHLTRKGAAALKQSVQEWVTVSTAVNAILLAPGMA